MHRAHAGAVLQRLDKELRARVTKRVPLNIQHHELVRCCNEFPEWAEALRGQATGNQRKSHGLWPPPPFSDCVVQLLRHRVRFADHYTAPRGMHCEGSRSCGRGCEPQLAQQMMLYFLCSEQMPIRQVAEHDPHHGQRNVLDEDGPIEPDDCRVCYRQQALRNILPQEEMSLLWARVREQFHAHLRPRSTGDCLVRRSPSGFGGVRLDVQDGKVIGDEPRSSFWYPEEPPVDAPQPPEADVANGMCRATLRRESDGGEDRVFGGVVGLREVGQQELCASFGESKRAVDRRARDCEDDRLPDGPGTALEREQKPAFEVERGLHAT
mmetsp:Transcript_103326/g.298877  ORF Transcript_103326/g.298877 Transcript_103326/m.298877 type:complete len:324 (+) Transcript_103326:92-1063(+)